MGRESTQPRCSIVIRCYNEERHIGRLLEGIMQQTLKAEEIIVVDSGSTDATVSIASRYPTKILSMAPEDFAFGRSLNLGCREATAPLIVAASAHVYPVYQDWLESLLAPFSDPHVALAYGKQRGDESTRYSERRVFSKWFPNESRSGQDHPFCNNANAALRRSVWENLPYDETLTGLEDVDWAKRAMQLGHRIVYVASAEVIHVHDETPRRIYNRYRREAIALKRIYPEERFTLLDLVRLLSANITSDLYHAWRENVLWTSLSDILLFRLMQFWGTYRGHSQRGSISRRLRETFYYPSARLTRQSAAETSECQRRVEYANPSGREENG